MKGRQEGRSGMKAKKKAKGKRELAGAEGETKKVCVSEAFLRGVSPV